MADRDDEQTDWRELVDDELIKQLVPDPSSPDVNVLTGVLLGRGRDEKWLRVYTTLQLNQFVEVPVDRILGVKRFPMGQIAVWIPADVNVQVTTTTTLSGDFLKGSIQATHGAATTRGVGGLISALVGTGGGGTSFGGCPTDLWGDPNCPIPNTSSPPLCGPNPPTGCRC
jgi:hypothetical protein